MVCPLSFRIWREWHVDERVVTHPGQGLGQLLKMGRCAVMVDDHISVHQVVVVEGHVGGKRDLRVHPEEGDRRRKRGVNRVK